MRSPTEPRSPLRRAGHVSALLPLVLATLVAAPIHAEVHARLVRDIDRTAYTGSSRPRGLQDLGNGNGYVFTAFGGRELWMIDTREDTVDAVLQRPEIRTLGYHLWASREESGGWSLWTLTVHRVAAFLTPIEGGPFVAAPRRVDATFGTAPWLFEADDGSGRALWAYDVRTGTFAEVARPPALGGGRLAREATRLFPNWEGQRTLFVARTASGAAAVWVSDGTPGGTRPIFVPGVPAPGLSIVGAWSGRALISVAGTGECPGAELWTTDGTAAGTRPLHQIVPGAACAHVVQALQTVDRFLPGPAFLVIDDRANGRELWRSDGTRAGTRRLTTLEPQDPFGTAPLPGILTANGYLFFADDGAHGREPWITDGTGPGTRRLGDLCPGACGTSGAPLGSVWTLDGGPVTIFAARTPGRGREPWVTDGTAAGTRLLADVCPGGCSSDPADLHGDPHSSLIAYFNGVTAGGERARFATGGTPETTVRLTPPGVRVTRGESLGETFAAADAASGEELWRTSGTPETTRRWYDLERERSGGSFPQPLAAAGARLIFAVDPHVGGPPLWGSDGSAAGTLPLPGPSPQRSDVYFAASVGSRALVAGPTQLAGTGDMALWSLNGRSGGNRRLTPAGVVVRSPLRAIGDRAFFVARDAAHGDELWVSDGTAAGTRLVVDLSPGSADTVFHQELGTLRGELLFRRVTDLGNGLAEVRTWVSDGTAAGTRLLLDAYPFLGALERNVAWEMPMGELGGRLVFAGSDESFVEGIYTTDFTAGGTAVLIPGPARLRRVLVARSRLYLLVEALADDSPDPFYETTLWVSDGTPANTHPLAGELAEQAFEPVVMDDGLLFTGPWDGSVTPLWVTDGTVAGSGPLHGADGEVLSAYGGRGVWFADRLVFAVEVYDPTVPYGFAPCLTWAPGEPFATALAGAPLCGRFFAPIGARVFFSGWEPTTGAELWALEVD